MKIWVLTVLNDIHNNYKGIDDVETYLFSTRSGAIGALVNRSTSAIRLLKDMAKCEYEDLEVEERKHFFHANNGQDYITCKIEEKDVL